MGDQMARLGRMVDEALSGVGGMPKVTNAPTRTSRTASAEGYGPRVLEGGALHQAVEDICWIY